MPISTALISPPSFCVNDDRLEQHLGLAYIAAILEDNDIPVAILELTGHKEDDFETILRTIPPADLFGISCYSTNYFSVKRIVQHIRHYYPSSLIVLGGPHPSAMPQETMKDLHVDSIIRGEGEISYLKTIQGLNHGISPEKIIEGEPPRDLDALPFPVRTIVNQESYSRTFLGEKTLSLITSRGCRFHCLHCNSTIMGGGTGSTRFRSPQNVSDEIAYLKELGYTSLRFNDDNFSDHPRLVDLLDEIGKQSILYRIFARLDQLNERNLEALHDSGCRFIDMGLESMNQENLRMLGKGNMLKSIRNLEIAHRLGIVIRASFMVGLPYDTDESVLRDFQKAIELPFEEFAVYPLLPYPGTRIWNNPEKYGYEIHDKDFTRYIQIGTHQRTAYTMSHSNAVSGTTFSPADVERWHGLANEILGASKTHMKDSKIAR